MHKILFLHNYFHQLPAIVEKLVNKVFDNAAAPFQIPNSPFDLIMIYNGEDLFSEQAMKYVVNQFHCNVPVLIFPYCSVEEFCTAPIDSIHPLQLGTQRGSAQQIVETITICQPTHAVMRNVTQLSCGSMSRDTSVAKSDSKIIATYSDGVPLVVERGMAMALNFCLANYQSGYNEVMLMTNAIEYMIAKSKKKIFKAVPKAYRDTELVCQVLNKQ